jgi:hypothetical protein
MKALIISFCISFTFLCVCLEVFFYIKMRDRLSSIANRRKKRALLCEDIEPKRRSEVFPAGKGPEDLADSSRHSEIL